MKLLKLSIGFMGIVALGTWPAVAAPMGDSEVSMRVGAAIPTGANGLDNSNTIGPLIGARYLYQMTSNIGVGGQFDFFHLPGNTQSIGSLDDNAVDNIYTGEIVGRYSFHPDATWVPYVSMGLGVARMFQTTQATPNNDNTWNDTGTMETRTIDHGNSTGYALSYGGGVEKMLTSSLFGALEATWNTFGASRDSVGASTLNFPDISLRLGWQFGGK